MARKKSKEEEKKESKEPKKGEEEKKELAEPAKEEKKEEAKVEKIEEFAVEPVSEEKEISEVFEEGKEEKKEEGAARVEEPKEEIVEERIYNVPLHFARRGPKTKWAKKSIRYLREFITKHFKPESLIISQEVNEAIWKRGIKKPPRKLKIRATKNADNLVVVYLA